jgi:hypothetical protein
MFAYTTDLYKVAEDYKTITGVRLAVSQRALNIQQKEHK